jgi:hypothetical protein
VGESVPLKQMKEIVYVVCLLQENTIKRAWGISASIWNKYIMIVIGFAYDQFRKEPCR